MTTTLPASALELRSLIRASGELELTLASVAPPVPGPGDVLVRIVREATLKVDELEDAWLAGRWRKKRMDLGNMRRLLVRLRRLLGRPAGVGG